MLKLERKILGLAFNSLTTLPGYQTLVASLDRAKDTLHSTAHQLLASLISEADAATPGGKIFYVHTDQVGTPQVLTDETGAVVWRASYDPYGMATVTLATGNPIPEMDIRMPGQYFDQETGLHYNYYRDYDPKSGRYPEVDAIGLAGGTNPYVYGYNNPLRYTDPSGLKPIPCPPGSPEGATCDDGTDNQNSPPVCVTAECAANILPNPPSDACDIECGFASDAWSSRQMVCTPIGGVARLFGAPGWAVSTGCKIIASHECKKKCEKRKEKSVPCTKK